MRKLKIIVKPLMAHDGFAQVVERFREEILKEHVIEEEQVFGGVALTYTAWYSPKPSPIKKRK